MAALAQDPWGPEDKDKCGNGMAYAQARADQAAMLLDRCASDRLAAIEGSEWCSRAANIDLDFLFYCAEQATTRDDEPVSNEEMTAELMTMLMPVLDAMARLNAANDTMGLN
ncbi:hypothetical protein KUV46_15860 [Thalassovita mediterranea]|nr:hypothetical protein KUV46_15860 [Thalassovita mediterranea]